MNSRPTPIPCPHKECPYAFPQIKGFQSQIRQHLITLHTHQENLSLNPSSLHKLHCYPCFYCHTVYATIAKQQQHTQRQHPTSCTQTNIDIVLQTYPQTTIDPIRQQQTIHNWNKTLTWLHSLQITPPLSRRTIYHKLTAPHKKLLFAILNHIIQWCNNSMIPFSPDSPSFPPNQTTATPFLKLLLTFESLFLAEPKTPSKQSYHNLLLYRHELLKTGRIQELYNSTRQPLHLHTNNDDTPTLENPPPIFNDLQHNRAAQFAADQDNLHSAYNRIKSVTPKATLTPHYLSILKTLYPPRLAFQPPPEPNNHVTRSRTADPNITTLQLTPDHLLTTFRKQKRGTAPGPFADSIDLIRDYATHTTHRHQHQFPYLHSITTLINHFLSNRTPPDIQSTYAAQYVIALHKDQTNLNKIRPIGIGTALRRITAAAAITLHGQLGINVPGGLDFIVHSTQAQIHTYINQPQPTRALLTLDITNMFNAISRQACRHTLTQNPSLQPLLPIFDLLYSNDNQCWYQTPNHDYQHFPQAEGFTQGCPLSGAFADIVLTLVLEPINQQLQTRIQQRSPHEIPPTTLSYHDDTNIVIPYPDISWFLNTFQTLGTPIGIQLNLSKTQILTSLSPQPPTLTHIDEIHLQATL